MANPVHLYLLLVLIIYLCRPTNSTLAMEHDDNLVRNEFRNMLKNYNRRIRPNYSGRATVINVDLAVLKFGNINEVGMTYLVDVFLQQQWRDERLKHNLSQNIIPMLGLKIPTDFIWTPDTHFINAQKATKHMVTVSNDKWELFPDGTVFWSTRITVIASCKMNFRKYPMDTQICGLELESYAYPEEHLKYQWFKRGVAVFSKEMSQFILTNTVNTSYVQLFGPSGSFSILEASFTFKRQISVAIIQIFFPCIMIVSVSWISFWIHKNCVSSRFGIGVTTLLTICTIWGSVNRRLPTVDYVKAVDIYFIVSFCFILCVIIEFALVLNFHIDDLHKKKNRLQNRGTIKRKNVHAEQEIPFLNSIHAGLSNLAKRHFTALKTIRTVKENHVMTELDNRGRYVKFSYTERAETTKIERKLKNDNFPTWFSIYPVNDKSSKLDVVSRMLFPAMYLCFNMAFFYAYDCIDQEHLAK